MEEPYEIVNKFDETKIMYSVLREQYTRRNVAAYVWRLQVPQWWTSTLPIRFQILQRNKTKQTKMCNLSGAAEAETTNSKDNRNNNRQQQ